MLAFKVWLIMTQHSVMCHTVLQYSVGQVTSELLHSSLVIIIFHKKCQHLITNYYFFSLVSSAGRYLKFT
jgi:hypothetical protein